MRIVLTGGAGFLGSHLSDLMLADGHEIVVIDSLITGRVQNIQHLLNHPNFEFCEQDACDPFPVDGPVDAVMHMASPASPPDFRRIPFETLRAGSFATHRALEFARDKEARFLLASTSEIYGDPPAEFHPQKETYWGNVNTIGERAVYDEAKRYAEAVTMAFHREYGLRTRIVRIFNTYGPRMRADDGRVVTNLVSQALRGDDLTLYGGGNQTRSFCYVADLIAGIFKLLMSDEPYPVNIGNPGEFTVRELAEIVLEMTGSKSKLKEVPLPYSDDPRQRKPDITRAKTILKWEPKIPLREGLVPTIEYMRGEVLAQR